MKIKFGLLLFCVVVLFASCTINRNVMFKTDHDYTFDTPPSDSIAQDYEVSPNDVVLFRLFSNNGARLLELTAATEDSRQVVSLPSFTYTVEPDGMIDLPEIGKVQVSGMTIRQIQDDLEIRYATLYKNPYALVEVMNNRVIVFPGTGGDAMVIVLQNRNTTVIEALALAGGLADRGDASKVKLIRNDQGTQQVFLMDMSTIEGIQFASMTVQANDIIYVEPVPEIAREIFQDVSPFVSIVSGLALIYAIVIRGF
jgi:polysaccharide biosynthesis/export protein